MCGGKIQYHQLGTMEIEIPYKLRQLQKQTKTNAKTNVFIRFWNIFVCWKEQLLSDIKLNCPWLNTCTMSMYQWSYANILIKHINIISQRVPLVEQELFTFPRKLAHIQMPWVRSGCDNTNSWPWVKTFCVNTKSLQDRELKQVVRIFCVNTKSLQDRELKQAMTTRTPAKTGSENR